MTSLSQLRRAVRSREDASAKPQSRSLRDGLRAGLWRAALGTGTALLAVWTVVPQERHLVGAAVAALPAVGMVLGLWLHRPPRLGAWIAFGIGLFMILAGAVTLAMVGELDPSSLARAGQISLLVGVYVQLGGMYVLVHGGRTVDRWVPVDVGVVLAAAFTMTWFVVLDPAVDAGLKSQVPMPILLAYLATNFAFAELALRLLLTRNNRLPALWFTLVAIGAVLFSQIAFTYAAVRGAYVGGGFADIGWIAGSVAWTLVALHPSMVRLADSAPVNEVGRISASRIVGMSLAALIPSSILIAQGVIGQHDYDTIDLLVAGFATAAIFGLVILRLSGALSELRRSLHLREQLESELIDQSRRDALTGLGNRAHFSAELETALLGDPSAVVVLYCDLDDFKSVNDGLGHAAGDAMLVGVGERLQEAVRAGDIVARLGGDEFGVLLRGVAEAAMAVQVAERVIAAFAEPLAVEGHDLRAGVSVGLAFGDRSRTADDLLRNADIAMYLAKTQGKGRYELFHPSLHRDVVSRIGLRASLEHAIEAKEFAVHYQPIVDLASGRPIALEALVRWMHPERGIVPPGEFIPLAEATGLIVPLGRWVLNEACSQMSSWIGRGLAGDVALTVNLSPAQIRHPEIVDDIRHALRNSGLPAERLTLEVTEGSITDLAQATRILQRIRELGVAIAIDDFGTGYSALSYLSRLPVDHIKIDRSFIDVLGRSPRETALTETVLRIAHQLQLGTVAEGIETAAQASLLRSLGCHQGQGYFFSRPADARAIEDFLGGARAA